MELGLRKLLGLGGSCGEVPPANSKCGEGQFLEEVTFCHLVAGCVWKELWVLGAQGTFLSVLSDTSVRQPQFSACCAGGAAAVP